MGACPTSRDATKSHKAGIPSKFPNVLLNNPVEFWEIFFGRPEPSAGQQVGHAIPGFLKSVSD